MDLFHLLSALLMDVEVECRRLQLWELDPPTPEALASTEPFCLDTLTFSQWLQFVFLVRMSRLIDHRATLPVSCQVAPMAEEYFDRLALDAHTLIARLRDIDELLSTA